jgi:hypothetical protein
LNNFRISHSIVRTAWAFTAVVLLALTQHAAAQGPAGANGVASIPGSTVRADEYGRPVAQLGLIGILTNPPPPTPYVDSTQMTTPGGKGQIPPK